MKRVSPSLSLLTLPWASWGYDKLASARAVSYSRGNLCRSQRGGWIENWVRGNLGQDKLKELLCPHFFLSPVFLNYGKALVVMAIYRPLLKQRPFLDVFLCLLKPKRVCCQHFDAITYQYYWFFPHRGTAPGLLV